MKDENQSIMTVICFHGKTRENHTLGVTVEDRKDITPTILQLFSIVNYVDCNSPRYPILLSILRSFISRLKRVAAGKKLH